MGSALKEVWTIVRHDDHPNLGWGRSDRCLLDTFDELLELGNECWLCLAHLGHRLSEVRNVHKLVGHIEVNDERSNDLGPAGVCLSDWVVDGADGHCA